VHFVNAKLDAGKKILQKKVKVNKNDNAKILAKRILRQEHKIYPLALNKVISSL
jgi:phosphoribosylglycinamide formyltransferase-1